MEPENLKYDKKKIKEKKMEEKIIGTYKRTGDNNKNIIYIGIDPEDNRIVIRITENLGMWIEIRKQHVEPNDDPPIELIMSVNPKILLRLMSGRISLKELVQHRLGSMNTPGDLRLYTCYREYNSDILIRVDPDELLSWNILGDRDWESMIRRLMLFSSRKPSSSRYRKYAELLVKFIGI